MKNLILLLLLLVNCAFFYPCKIVDIQEEKCNKLIEIDITYHQKYKLERHVRELYKWKTRRCNCYKKYFPRKNEGGGG